jgi:hypothetical protein
MSRWVFRTGPEKREGIREQTRRGRYADMRKLRKVETSEQMAAADDGARLVQHSAATAGSRPASATNRPGRRLCCSGPTT